MKKILLSILFCLFAIPAFATQYYINYGVGNDTNNGTSTGTPFNTCTPIEGTNFLKPGDIVSIYYTNDFVNADAHCHIASAGSPTNHITINTYGGVGNAIFDQSVNITSVAGWTGWNFYSALYTFTITSASTTSGATYTDGASNVFTVKTNISSSTTLVTTSPFNGTPTGPTLTNTSCPNGGCASTITFSGAVESAQIYVSQTTIPFAVSNVNIDDSYSLRRIGSENTETLNAMYTSLDSYYNAATAPQVIYIQLSDGSSPGSHTVSVGGEYFNTQFVAVVSADATYSQYIDFNNITAQDGYNYGFSSGAPYTTFTNCIGQFNGREGFLLQLNGVFNGVGAAYDQITNSQSQWNNGFFTGSAGQGITIEAPHVTLTNVTDNDNWMAGIDWLNYPASSPQTNASYGKCINCIMFNNGLRAWGKDEFGNDPACMYIDGGNKIQVINSVCYAQSPLTSSNSNSIFGISMQTEHPSTFPDHDIDIINTLITGAPFLDVQSGAINCSGNACNVNYNLRIAGSTMGSSGSDLIGLGAILSTGNVYLYNNIYYNNRSSTTGSSPCFDSSGTQTCNVFSDYNTYYNTVSGSKIWDKGFGSAFYTLTSWNSLSGQDAHSQFGNPTFTTGTPPSNVPSGFFLSVSSNALAYALPNYLGNQYVFSSIGTVLASLAVDNPSAPADGYHYYATLSSSSFPSTQVGSDIGGSVY